MSASSGSPCVVTRSSDCTVAYEIECSNRIRESSPLTLYRIEPYYCMATSKHLQQCYPSRTQPTDLYLIKIQKSKLIFNSMNDGKAQVVDLDRPLTKQRSLIAYCIRGNCDKTFFYQSKSKPLS